MAVGSRVGGGVELDLTWLSKYGFDQVGSQVSAGLIWWAQAGV